MTTFQQFSNRAKMRHDFSDQIQVRYAHPNGENFDTWISGEEAMSRLNSESRERLIKSFSTKEWRQLREKAADMIDEGKEKARRHLRDRAAKEVSDALGDNIFGDTLADNIRGTNRDVDPHEQERLAWQGRLQDKAFRRVALELAWINLEGTFPDEKEEAPDDWI